jgi:hypothetical protein
MKWLEVIELRTIESNYNFVKNELISIIKKINEENKEQIIKMYVNANYESDISIHIISETYKVQKDGSELGLRIAFNIKEFGLVNHYVLQEIIPDRKKQ